jgi:hypothetical protein
MLAEGPQSWGALAWRTLLRTARCWDRNGSASHNAKKDQFLHIYQKNMLLAQ